MRGREEGAQVAVHTINYTFRLGIVDTREKRVRRSVNSVILGSLYKIVHYEIRYRRDEYRVSDNSI